MFELAVPVSSFFRFSFSVSATEDGISFKNRFMAYEDIQEMKFGISPLRFDMFYVGRQHQICLRDNKKSEISFKVKSFFGLDNKEHFHAYSMILKTIWEKAAKRIIDEKINLWSQGNSFMVNQCIIYPDGIEIAGKKETNSNSFISWDDLHYQKKYDRLTLTNLKNPKVYTNLYYMEGWNVDIFMNVLDWIMKQRTVTL